MSCRITIADSDTNYYNNSPLAGAVITLERTTSTSVFIRTAITDHNGYYTFNESTAGVYKMTVSCDGYITVSQILNVRYNESNIQNLVIEAISDRYTDEGYAQGTVIDAKTGRLVPGITVYIREGIGNLSGEVLYKTTTDSSGMYTTGAPAPGNYSTVY